MDPNKTAELRREEQEAKDKYFSNASTLDEYHKKLVFLAFEHAMNGDIQTATDMVERIPESYFSTHILGQMRVDPLFASAATHLSRMVSLYAHPELSPTQAAAEA
jgi:hypothetical protein